MKIPSIGNYLTEGGRTAVVRSLGFTVCSGHVGDHEVIWSLGSGCATSMQGNPLPLFNIVSPAPVPWRERIIQLIETAHRHTDRINHPDTLVSGGLRIAIGGVGGGGRCGGKCVVLARDDVAEPVFLLSPEFVGAVDARLKELETADLRYRDDANVLLIEALLQ